MKETFELELTDIYGSAGFPREMEVEKQKLSRIKKRSRTSSKLGNLKQDTETAEINTEKQIEKVNSFKLDEKGRPLLRLGGAYGKLVGLLKQSGMVCATANEEGIESKTQVLAVIPSIQVIPEYVPLEMNGSKIETVSGLVSVNSSFGGRGTQKPTTWDVIKKAKCEVTLIYPDNFHPQVQAMLRMAQQLNFCERRRGKMKIIRDIK